LRDRVITGLVFGTALGGIAYIWICSAYSGLVSVAGIIPTIFIQTTFHSSKQFSSPIGAVLSSATYFFLGLLAGIYGGGVKGSYFKKLAFSAGAALVGLVVLSIITVLLVIGVGNLKS